MPVALAALDRGGTLAVAGIHLSDIPALDYQRHLFRERTLTSVTANTRADGEELLALATRLGVRPQVQAYDFEDAFRALSALRPGVHRSRRDRSGRTWPGVTGPHGLQGGIRSESSAGDLRPG